MMTFAFEHERCYMWECFGPNELYYVSEEQPLVASHCSKAFSIFHDDDRALRSVHCCVLHSFSTVIGGN